MRTSKSVFVWAVPCLSLMALGYSIEASEAITAPDGVEIRFDHHGNGDGEPTLIFVHGWANDRSIWDAQVDHFSKKYEVITVDLPGFGESGSDRDNFTITSFGEDIATIIPKLSIEHAVLIGFSMGAPVVIETAIRVPDQITGVILVDELHDVELRSTPAAISETAAFFLDLVANPTNEKLVSSGFYVNNTEASFLKISTMLKGAPRIGWEDSLLDALNWLNEGFADSVSHVQAPIISINSDMRPTNIEAFRKYVPSFQAKVVPGAGHLVMWDAPDVFNDLLEESIQEMKIHWEERLD